MAAGVQTEVKKSQYTPILWAINIGKVKDKGVRDPIKEARKPNDNDVYPLSIHFFRWPKIRMMLIRIIVFIACFYFVVPFDLYITSHQRIYYFGTDLYRQRIPFSTNQTGNYSFNL